MSKRANMRRILALLLAIVMTIPLFANPVMASEPTGYLFESNNFENTTAAEITSELATLRGAGGLVGFEGNYALTRGNDLVRVIVLFNNSPAPTQVAEATLGGRFLSLEQATSIVETDHQLFRQELAELLGFGGMTRNHSEELGITREFTEALNGVVVTLPSYAVELVAEFESVFAVYPDEMIFLDPVIAFEEDDEAGESAYEDVHNDENTSFIDGGSLLPPSVNNDSDRYQHLARQTYTENTGNTGFTMPSFGNSLNRHNSGADIIHDFGFRGEGIVIGILDSGIDYYHPAFEGAFLTLEQAHARGMYHITEADLIDGFFYGRNYINEANFSIDRVTFGEYLTANNITFDPRDPMETRYDRWANTNIGVTARQFWTTHGTHVAGTIAARPVAHHLNGGAMGFAPEAQIFMYRVMGPTGAGTMSDILAGIDQIAIDKPDVVNMSIGGASNAAADIQAIAVNNVALAHDIVFVIAAGNSGDEMHTVGRPATASAAIAVAATIEPRSNSVTGTISSDGTSRTFTSRPRPGAIVTPGTVTALWYQPEGASHLQTTLHPANEDGSYNLVRLPYHQDSPNAPLWVHENVDPENFLGTGFFPEWLQFVGITDFEYPNAAEMADWFANNMDRSLNRPFEINTLRNFLRSMILYVPAYNSPILSDGSSGGVTRLLEQHLELLGGNDAVFALYVYNSFMRVHSSTTAGPQVAIREIYAEETGITFTNNTIPWNDDFYKWLMPYIDETFGDNIEAFLIDLDFGRGLETAHDFWHYTRWVGMSEFERQMFNELVPEDKLGFLDGAFLVLGSVNLSGVNGNILVNNSEFATRLGAAGVLSLGRDGATGLDFHSTIPYIGLGTSATMGPVINGLTDECTITFTGRAAQVRSVTPFSSRGPVGSSFEIKPDISAQGFGVVSTMPAFYDNQADDPYWNAYAPMTGTSMASPGIAGKVALMRQFSNYHNLDWNVGEIKSRLMNTAEPTGVRIYTRFLGIPLGWGGNLSNPSVYEVGAGFGRVDRAIFADIFAAANYDRVFTNMQQENSATMQTGSISLAGVNTWSREGDGMADPINETTTVTLNNSSNSPATYTISARRNTASRVGITATWPEGVEITFDTDTVVVPPRGSAAFQVNLHIPSRPRNAPRLQLEGWVELRREGVLEISMPFGAGVENVPPHLTDHFLMRDVITTGESAFHSFSSHINMQYIAWRPTIAPAFLFDINNFDPYAWRIDAIVGYFGPKRLSLPGEEIGVERIMEISNGTVGRYADSYTVIGEPFFTLKPGDYAMAWENRQATGTAESPAIGPWSYSEYFPFTVNNTPPEITIVSRRMNAQNELVIAGKVTDSLDRGFNALFAASEEDAKGERVTLDEAGNFTFTAPAGAQYVTFYAVDEYLPVPKAMIEGESNFPIELEATEDGLHYFIGNNVTELIVTPPPPPPPPPPPFQPDTWAPPPTTGGGTQPTKPDVDTEEESETPLPPTQENLFDDVLPADWFYDYVTKAANEGLFQGTAHKTFSPNINMTRAMFVQVLANMAKDDQYATTAEPTFADVPSDAWFFEAVEWAASIGIVQGIDEFNFAPEAPITREQMAVMLYRLIQMLEIELPTAGAQTTFTDQNSVSDWARDAVNALTAAGIFTGRPDGSFDPLSTATRAEVATVFVRLIGIMQ